VKDLMNCPRCGGLVEESFVRVTDDSGRDLCHACWSGRLDEIQQAMLVQLTTKTDSIGKQQ